MSHEDTVSKPGHITNEIIQRAEAAKDTFWGYLGCELDHAGDGKATVHLDVQPHHFNLMKMVHGGVLSSMLDNAMGLAVMTARPGENTVTTNLNVHFVAPMKGERLIVSAEVIHSSRSTLTVYGTVSDETGLLGTVGTASFRIV